MSTFLRLAVRNVARNRRRSLVTLSAVLLGVTAVLSTRGIMDGFLRLMVEDVVKGRTGALQVHPAGYMASVEALPLEPSLPYDNALLSRIQGVAGVAGVSGRLTPSPVIPASRPAPGNTARGPQRRRSRLQPPIAGTATSSRTIQAPGRSNRAPSASSRLKFCVLRAPTWNTST